jgi:hypothetical protein
VNGHYRGDARRGLFAGIALADSNALLSVSARRVARKVVRAIQRRDTVVFIGWRTRLVAAMQGVMPRALAALYRTVARALPESSTQGGETGEQLAPRLEGRWRRVAERSRAKHNQPAPSARAG